MSLPPDTGSVEIIAYREYVSRLLAKGERPDHRSFDSIRLPSVAREVTATSSGASSSSPTTTKKPSLSSSPPKEQVSQDGLLSSVILRDDGGTCIACTVHAVFGPPWTQRPNRGRLNVRVTAPFLLDLMSASGFTSAGGRGGAAVATGLADYPLRQVEGYVRGVLSACLDLSQLAIYPAEACWVLTVTLTLINVDGGIRAAALHAAVAALHGLLLPRALLPNGAIVQARRLRLTCVPVACTYGVVAASGGGGGGVQLLADTSAIEENVADGVVTVAVDEEGNLIDLQQLGRYPLMPSVLGKIVEQLGNSREAQALRERLTSV